MISIIIFLIPIIQITAKTKPKQYIDQLPISVPQIQSTQKTQSKIIEIKKILRILTYTEQEKTFYSSLSTKELFNIIMLANKKEEALKAIDNVLKQIFDTIEIAKNSFDSKNSFFSSWLSRISSYLGYKKQENTIVKKLILIFKHTLLCAHAINKNFSLAANDINKIQAINFLKAILFQSPANNIANSYSYSSIIQSQKLKQQIKAHKQKKGDDINELKAIADLITSPNLKQEWFTFVKNFQDLNSPKLNLSLIISLRKIKKLNTLPLWLNIAFTNAWIKNKKNAQVTAINLIQDFKDSKDFIQELYYKNKRLKKIDLNLATEKVSQQWNKFKKEILDFYLISNVSLGRKENIDKMTQYNFIITYNSLHPLGKLVAISNMQNIENIFNDYINKLNKYSQSAPLQKTTTFLTLLKDYNSLLLHWKNFIKNEYENTKQTEELFSQKIMLSQKAIQFLEKKLPLLSKKEITKQFSRSTNFQLSQAIFNNQTKFNTKAQTPNTLEDTRILIHENLTKIMQMLTNKIMQKNLTPNA